MTRKSGTSGSTVVPSREYYQGSSTASTSAAFTISKIYLRDSNSVTDVTANFPDGPSAPTYTSNGSTCTVENYLSELLYRVYYGENSKGQYTIKAITIDFMLDKLLSLDQDYCQSDNTKTYLLNQKFGIEFNAVRTDSKG